MQFVRFCDGGFEIFIGAGRRSRRINEVIFCFFWDMTARDGDRGTPWRPRMGVAHT